MEGAKGGDGVKMAQRGGETYLIRTKSKPVGHNKGQKDPEPTKSRLESLSGSQRLIEPERARLPCGHSRRACSPTGALRLLVTLDQDLGVHPAHLRHERLLRLIDGEDAQV